MLRMTRRAALLGVVGAAVAACSKAKPSATESAPTSPPSPSPTPVPSATPTTPAAPVDTRPRWPLTGKLLKDKGQAEHAPVAVKVPDNRYEHPQRGIEEADIVFVELDGYRDAKGYSATRLVPVFHSKMADAVAPVRSIRPVDIPLLSPMNALIGNTGAAPWVINYVKHYRAHLEGMLSFVNTIGTGSYGTDTSRIYTFNGQKYYDRAIICHPKVLAKQTKRFRSGPTQPYFPFAFDDDEISSTKGKPATSIKVPYKGDDYFMSYSYDKKSKRYRRSMPWGPHVLADGTRVTTDNVLVIKSKQRYDKIFKGSGHDEPIYDIINGKGTFYYFNRGRYVTGNWSKGKVNEPFTFTLANGQPFKMATGRTFVEQPNSKAKIHIKD